jgi:replication factor C subunit 1
MRLRASGDRDEIRQQYMPALWDKMVRPLMVDGKDAVEGVIDLMDSYFITREDFDSVVELGLGPMSESEVNIHPQTKSAFTRIYNQRSHPVPFMKATNVLAPKKGPKVKPDIEDAIEDSDEEEIVEDAKEEDEEEELDLKKDKYVKVPKAKKAAAKGKKAKAKNDDEDDEEEKPKKGRKGKAKAK